MNFDPMLVYFAAVLIGGAIRILIDGTRLDAWLRVKLGQPPAKKKS